MPYKIDYNDERLVEVTNKKDEALTQHEQTYDNMINDVDSKYNALIDASKEAAELQQQNQQAQTDFAIDEINQQREQAEKDYQKEQTGAYVDWQREKDSYGVGAEQRAAAGLAGSGYSESSQVSLYNTYQNRVSTARESFNRANLNYDNMITQARLQNSSILAEIALTALQQQLELSLQGFQYKNQLITERSDKRLTIENMYHSQYMDVLGQINQEKAMEEQIRQYNETLALQRSRASSGGSGGDSGGGTAGGSGGLISNKKSSAASAAAKAGAKAAAKAATFNGSTYEEAVSHLKKYTGNKSGVMNKREWAYTKKTNPNGMYVQGYNSYEEYLRDYVNYMVEINGMK